MAVTRLERDRKGMRVLLMDGNASFLNAVGEYLARVAAELEIVSVCGGVQDILELASDVQPQLILFSLDNSRQSGLKVILDLKGRLPGVRIIILSLLDSPSFRRRVLEAGADDFVFKGNAITDLLPSVQQFVSADDRCRGG